MCEFRVGDHVAIESKSACSDIHFNAPLPPGIDASKCFDLIGKVVQVAPTGHVEVAFGEGIWCTVKPKALVKIPELQKGDLVQLVNDTRVDKVQLFGKAFREKTDRKGYGDICRVLKGSSWGSDEISVEWKEREEVVRRLELSFVARPIYGDISANSRPFGCNDRATTVWNLCEVLQDAMHDLPDVDLLSRRPFSVFSPGMVLQVAGVLDIFLRGKLEEYHKVTTAIGRNLFSLLGQGSRSAADAIRHEEAKKTIVSLLKHGKVFKVNSDEQVIVEFPNGRVWCIHSNNLTFAVRSDWCDQGCTGTSCRNILSEAVDCAIRNTDLEYFPALRDGCLEAACYSGNMSFVKPMLEAKGGLECTDANGNKPLHYAAFGNQPEMLKFLLRSGANINATNKRNHTALHFAVNGGFLNCVRELTKHHEKLDANIRDDNGNTALHIAIDRQSEEILNELFQLRTVKFTITNKYGVNHLHAAALKGNKEAVEKILSKRCDLLNLKEEDHGYAALHFAAVNGRNNVLEALLIKESCIVDVENNREETALFLAAREGRFRTVELLVLAGAAINKRNRDGNTALHMTLKAAYDDSAKPWNITDCCASKAVATKLQACGHTDVERILWLACFLVRSGADINCPNEAGNTPLDIAHKVKEPAVQLLGIFLEERRNADSGKCRTCDEAAAHKSFTPFSHCLYCDDCGRCYKPCFSCRKIIARGVPTGPRSQSISRKEMSEVIPVRQPMLGPEVYSMTRNPRGWCIILNNVDFNNFFDRRDGSELDAVRMHTLFSQLHFKVTVRTNLSAMEMKDTLRLASEEEHQRDADCLVVILMSHGTTGVIYGSDAETVHLNRDVYQHFNNENCPALQGKPKIFFIQACRGDGWDHGTNAVRETSDTPQAPGERSTVTPTQPPKRIPILSDMYTAYASVPGYVALKEARTGSWFLSAVSEVFSEHACTTSLDGLMHRVHRNVMERTAHDGSKQTPTVNKIGWTKELYFNPGYHA